MIYDHIIVRYGELSLKGKNRHIFVNRLKETIKKKLKSFPDVQVNKSFDRMYILLNGQEHGAVIKKLQEVFGIQGLTLAIKCSLDLDVIKATALSALEEAGPHVKTFKVSTKRNFKQYPHDSQELNHLIGGHVLRNTENITVDVHHPDVEIKVEIKPEATFISCLDYPGAGGLPIGSSGKAMLMLSGGIDSPVAGYLTMKRGVRVEMVHFHSPPFTSERAKQKVEDLTNVLTRYGGGIKLHVVPFTDIQKAIQKQIPDNYSMTVMRRFMLRITERLALKSEALAIATGENLGQVASQTLSSMHTINQVTNLPIIRPLVTMDKIEIIDISRKIDTYDISIRPYEDCCTVFLPSAPKTKPNREKANRFEQNMEIEALIDQAVENTETVFFSETDSEQRDTFDDLL
ncbi:tRNA uracil 4-sulfurtransferase ThiI [Alkalihalobacillus sp. AL-G]|uniref:tRNA uracil 4-sulfurtransferase ThiI n=1 Tax=Alkalihalobacillus sp. AL-G TaxID=2926399 RepID=UPI00272B2960|nr:tRNA uracil 4-sulfurtransferase ThiI [Alkalihalobacillus sp. AL-G]WLD92383.1 tRNA 4-thiouridine(8) synthase ThiI [Alkalihalobacillus sp. AL-G]